MNAISGTVTPVIPENAPFSAAQRAWLNGFLAGLYGGTTGGGGAGMSIESSMAVEEDFPWHDPAMEMDERLSLAEGKPFERRLMAAMAQLDCGQCGYLCQTYAEALASGKETSPSLCVPGSKPTSKKVKELLADRPADSVAMAPHGRRNAGPNRAARHARSGVGGGPADGRELSEGRASRQNRSVPLRHDLRAWRFHRHLCAE